MPKQDIHPSDHEMLLAADGELSSREAARVRSHLTACWSCRSRMSEIEQTIVAFARAYRESLDPRQTSASGPSARLRARLAELSLKQEADPWRRVFQVTSAVRGRTVVVAAVLIGMMTGSFLLLHGVLRRPNSVIAVLEPDVLPDRALTPGATRTISSMSDVCSLAHEQVVKEVSMPMREEVFRRYGILNPRASDYEIDYLIAPGLGGVEAIRNLWPEPYKSRTWNAQVKDELEERLHEMVCRGQLDLSTAQRDIASDWIAAYKKYFHTDHPLALHLRMGKADLL
jgi:Putative zinc-finger